ncbi:4'-phosphopantetheinyl transferase superfamily protein [Streptomyces sp. NPDC005485]|uniref:4'-phosphopantetheinyl transferase family protein n=1 Tax=Streptomyces sp. NPDC005485 TaxID=3155591 RepID=UPI0033B95D7E
MMEELLPDSVVTVEAFGDSRPEGATLYPEEEALVARAVEKRRREFTTVRACARVAMEKLGVAPQPVLRGAFGAPRWPDGLIGSMTHCLGYGAAALARVGDLASIGIDAEPHEKLPDDDLGAVILATEADRLAGLAAEHPSVYWERVLFSAKESVYKAWFPLTGQWLDFSEADIELFVDTDTDTDTDTDADTDRDAEADADADPAAKGEVRSGRFRAELLVPGPLVGGARVGFFDGRWTVQGSLLATVVTVPHA